MQEVKISLGTKRRKISTSTSLTIKAKIALILIQRIIINLLVPHQTMSSTIEETLFSVVDIQLMTSSKSHKISLLCEIFENC